LKILYAKALVKDLEAVSCNPAVKKRLLKLIEKLKTIDTLDELHHIKKIESYDCYYRLRIGDYRLGLKLSGNTLELIRFLHRRDIYRRFP
jgi:mRNA interferase RelE/StbE